MKKLSIIPLIILTSCLPANNCNNDVIDIYYADRDRYYAYSLRCLYTKTPIGCLDCQTHRIKRSEYDAISKAYFKMGKKIPFSKRFGNDGVLPPINNGYLE